MLRKHLVHTTPETNISPGEQRDLTLIMAATQDLHLVRVLSCPLHGPCDLAEGSLSLLWTICSCLCVLSSLGAWDLAALEVAWPMAAPAPTQPPGRSLKLDSSWEQDKLPA